MGFWLWDWLQHDQKNDVQNACDFIKTTPVIPAQAGIQKVPFENCEFFDVLNSLDPRIREDASSQALMDFDMNDLLTSLRN